MKITEALWFGSQVNMGTVITKGHVILAIITYTEHMYAAYELLYTHV